ncbi:E3 ubiquitin-protein ligase TRIM47 [Pseudoliparis swirei]|uniref:E3 ubiquitin-protein ligase TRIM47 n=1 Tax=Pseudoliparis swirei TaxID=2059687 RepID=UPI0024BDDB96|nr:E3 ubiquitin-protein ligase TRIM47 [Pseudoliparis swirei]
MATAAGEDLRRELSCAICLDFFKDPVILKCGHNFCRFCICMHWDENGGEYGYQCPQCRTVFNKRSFTKNYLVQNLVDKLDHLDCLGSCPTPSKPVKVDGKCEQHGEELKLYCRTDKRPICVVCRESRAHRHHEVAPVPEVVNDMKMELKLRLMELNWQKSQCVKVRTADERTRTEARLKKQRLKDKIEADVGALVQFLLDERDSLLESLDSEDVSAVAVIDDNLKVVATELAAVDKAIAEIHGHINGKTNFESLAETYEKVLHCKPFPALDAVNCPAEFTDFSAPFQLIMWKKMMHVLHTMPQNLTLDPDTCHPYLCISDFDTKVEEGYVRHQEPDLPARFTRFCGILATAQYASGQHYWEVDVKDKGVWYLGVTTESSNRKGFVSLTPSSGYWSLCLQDRLYANGDYGRIPVADYWNSPRVGVFLDYDNGRLSFYDAVTMKRLYVFDACYFDEPVYPFFSPGKNDPGSRLQICHYY